MSSFGPVAGKISEEYVSAEQTITLAGQLVLAHGLSSQPKIVQFILVCKTAQHNYSIGDEIVIPATGMEGAASRGLSVVVDATNITIRYSSGNIVIINKTTGALGITTAANWRLVVKAWT